MDKGSPYYKQVKLLIDCIPHIAREKCFALKGGTAINLFVNDFPRLSVDIDLTYLPLDSRDHALQNVRAALTRIGDALNTVPDLTATLQQNKPDEMRIIVHSTNSMHGEAQIKIEVSPVSRGTIHEPIVFDVTDAVENEFGFVSTQVVSIPDLYGGKLTEFKGMTFKEVTIAELEIVPEAMMRSLKRQLTKTDSDFLYSFKHGEPDWNLAPHSQFQHLPAVKWKLLNIQKMSPQKRRTALENLETALQSWLNP